MGPSVFELDTKGICVMCLRRCDPGGGGEGRSGQCKDQRNHYQSLQSFKLLMRYLNIDVLQNCCNFAPSFLQSFAGECLEKKEIDMGVKLCGVCQDICEEFSDIYMKFEMIRLQLDECVQALYQMMVGGDKDKGRKVEWEKRIFGGGATGGSGFGQPWNPLMLFHANIADNLRKETLKKCELRVKTAVPRVTISKSVVPSTLPPTPVAVSNPSQQNSPASTPRIPSTTPPTCVITETSRGIHQSVEENSSSSLKVEAVYSPSSQIAREDNHQDLNDPLANDDYDAPPSFIQTEGQVTPTISWKIAYSQNDSTTTSSSSINVPIHQTPPRSTNLSEEDLSTSSTSCYCRSCNKSYASKETLKIHFNAVHTFEAFFHQLPEGTTESQLKLAVNQCIQQYKRFQNPGNMKNRPCSFCGKNFRDVFFLKLHILDNHFDEVLQALKYQSPEFTPKVVAKKRTGGGRGGSGSTSSAGSVSMPRYLTSRGRAGAKILEGYKGPIFSCPICQKVFTVKACMKRHFKTFHTKEGANQFMCLYCDKRFITGFNKRLHESSVHVWEMKQEFLKGELGEGVTEYQVKAVIKDIVREQERDTKDNKEKLLCAFCGRWCNDSWYFKMHLVENHFGEVVGRLKGGGLVMGEGEQGVGYDGLVEVVEEEENSVMQMEFHYEGEQEGGEVEGLGEEEDDEVMVVAEGRSSSGSTGTGGGDGNSAKSVLRKMLEDKSKRSSSEMDNSFVARVLDIDFDGGLDLD